MPCEFYRAALLLVLAVECVSSPKDQGEPLFNGKDLAGWKLVSPDANDSWKVVSSVSLDPADAKKLKPSGAGGDESGVLLRADVPHGSDLYSEKNFGDCQVHVEFLIPAGSNSG